MTSQKRLLQLHQQLLARLQGLRLHELLPRQNALLLHRQWQLQLPQKLQRLLRLRSRPSCHRELLLLLLLPRQAAVRRCDQVLRL